MALTLPSENELQHCQPLWEVSEHYQALLTTNKLAFKKAIVFRRLIPNGVNRSSWIHNSKHWTFYTSNFTTRTYEHTSYLHRPTSRPNNVTASHLRFQLLLGRTGTASHRNDNFRSSSAATTRTFHLFVEREKYEPYPLWHWQEVRSFACSLIHSPPCLPVCYWRETGASRWSRGAPGGRAAGGSVCKGFGRGYLP